MNFLFMTIDMISSVCYLLSAGVFWYYVYRAAIFEKKRSDFERMRTEQLRQMLNEQNQRYVGFLVIFEKLLRDLHQQTTKK